MHELAVTQNILRISLEEAEKHAAKRVKEIRLQVGELSDLVPECIQTYFEFVSSGSKAEGALIKIQRIPIIVQCQLCGEEEEIGRKQFRCPACGSDRIKIIRGREFLIESLEVE